MIACPNRRWRSCLAKKTIGDPRATISRESSVNFRAINWAVTELFAQNLLQPVPHDLDPVKEDTDTAEEAQKNGYPGDGH